MRVVIGESSAQRNREVAMVRAVACADNRVQEVGLWGCRVGPAPDSPDRRQQVDFHPDDTRDPEERVPHAVQAPLASESRKREHVLPDVCEIAMRDFAFDRPYGAFGHVVHGSSPRSIPASAPSEGQRARHRSEEGSHGRGEADVNRR